MEFEDDAFVLSARIHGETGAIVELLTSQHGRWAAQVGLPSKEWLSAYSAGKPLPDQPHG